MLDNEPSENFRLVQYMTNKPKTIYMRMTLFSDGFHSDTLTTYEDPLLRIKVEDNGISWRMIAYCGKKQIDSVDLERVRTSYMEKIKEDTKMWD